MFHLKIFPFPCGRVGQAKSWSNCQSNMKGLVFTKPKPEVEFRSILYVPPVSPMGKLVRDMGHIFKGIA
ncbi:hypothetical protein Bca52824_001210 [Brassica carinata]|uniref:Uncharacterized protein n=1 Tax=Brassica carinata TaxID=52824 RepID=A0A8X7WJQ1_BRACI|nr:hypothetical protein Bca52824_001210 [Brassica carinata]